MKKNKITTLILSAFMLFGSVAAIAACNKGPTKIDYAHNGSVKLQLNYEDHDFFRDGIGEVIIENYIDGDTTHFRNVYGDTSEIIKSRYYGIDTPESTGAIQPFGKKASAFTKSKLENAAANGTIVISSPFSTAEDGSAGTYKRPETDSSGTRYLSLVWIHESKKHAPVNELTLLNLWIVQEGLSWAKNTSEVPAYADVFVDAQKQAEKLVLNLWTDFDPDYNYGDYITVSLLDIKREVEKYLADPNYVNVYSGQNVRFTAVVGGYCDHILYLQQYYPDDEDDYSKGEWAGINFFVGMGAIPDEFTEVGALLEVVGKATNSENFGFQISDGKFISTASQTGLEDDICRVLLTAEQNHGEYEIVPFNYTKQQVNELISQTNYESLYCRTNVTDELYCNDAKVSKGGDITLYFEGCDFGAYIPFTYYGDPSNSGDPWKTADKYLGKTFKLSGVFGYSLFKYNDGTYNLRHQIVVCGNDDLVCLTDPYGTTTNAPYTVKEAVEKFDDRLPNVTYYVNGKVGEVYEEGSIIAHSSYPEITVTEALAKVKDLPDGGTSSSMYFIQGTVKEITSPYDAERQNMSFTIGDGANTMTVYGAKFGNGVEHTDISVGCNVQIEAKLHRYVKDGKVTPEISSGTVIGYINTSVVTFTMVDNLGNEIKIEKAGVPSAVTDVISDEDAAREEELKRKAIAEYLAKVVSGSTAIVKGVPTLEDNKIVYKDSTLQGIFLHGTRIEDPLTPEEASEIAGKLELNSYTTDAYYIMGYIVGDLEIDRSNPNMIRVNCTIEYDAHSFYITGATFKVSQEGVTIDDVALGAKIIVTGRLLRNADSTITTRRNGCQLVSLEVGLVA